MFNELEKTNTRPKPFEFYTASDLWTDEHTSNGAGIASRLVIRKTKRFHLINSLK